jgi:hypothetical protein
MNKESIDKIMNCQCLQSVIENDQKKHTVTDECHDGTTFIQTATDKSLIIFNCLTFYRKKVVDKFGRASLDRLEDEHCNIPFLHCPICGTKTKHNIPEESFYHQFQNEQS